MGLIVCAACCLLCCLCNADWLLSVMSRGGECVEVLADIAEEVLREDGLSGGDRLARTDVEM